MREADGSKFKFGMEKRLARRKERAMDKYSTTLSKRDKEILSRSLSSGGMTRRQAMKWLIAMGVSVAAANSLVAKLGEAATETPKRGGRIRAGGQSTTLKDTLDPARFNNSTDYSRGFTFYNGLTRLVGVEAKAEPELAMSINPMGCYRMGIQASQWSNFS